ncbi:hypothetical protein HKX48_007089 [Thoreauomyces humboldtii]|nr:hypothetical protein HKX48_007089 [Thoreauomyces humboldtii]
MPTSRYSIAHASTNGPGDARPTAFQIVKDENRIASLKDKVIFITGAASGLGIETAKALYATGAQLFFGVRTLEQGRKVADEIIQGNSEGFGTINVLELDLSSYASVRKCATEFLSISGKLNILINNAGVMACPEARTVDGNEMQFGTNHLGHFLLFNLLKDVLIASSNSSFASRVISLTSVGHRMSPVRFDDINFEKSGYDPWLAYGQSKTCNLQFATEVDRRFGSKGLHAWSVHPGNIMTALGRHLDEDAIANFMTPEFNRSFKDPEQGAATTVWAAIAHELEGKGGRYLEDVHIAEAAQGDNPPLYEPGYAAHAYNESSEARLWELSSKLVHL